VNRSNFREHGSGHEKPERRRAAVQMALLASLLLLGGASCRQTATGPATVPVTGTVTRKGNPVAAAVIDFYPSASDAKPVQSFTDESGQFDVQTYVDASTVKRGMVPGQYRVSIQQLDQSAPRTMTARPKNLLPEKYASPETSGLTLTVPAEGVDDAQFHVD
jgi:hypothetical protein